MINLLSKHRSFIIQFLIVAFFLIFLLFIGTNYYRNVTERNIGIGFGFLKDTAGFSISQSLIKYTESDTFGRTFLVGLMNTLLASVISIVLATILGFFLGLLSLSKNWLAVQISQGFIELIRNVPPLLHVIFWYQVFFLKILPPLEDSIVLPGKIYINIRGITFPEIHPNPGVWIFWTVFFIFLFGQFFLSWFKEREVQQGRHRTFWHIRLGLLILPILVLVIQKPFYVLLPEFNRFRFTTGETLLPELFSVIAAMSVYTSSFIAGIVRNSIINVSIGQIEAAQSLGFNRYKRLRLIVIPQALKTMIPPVTNQYLNIIKNTSLGVAIAYPDLTAVFAGTALNQSGRALEIMAMVMFTYLAINLVTAAFMNIYNKRIINKKGRQLQASEIEKIGAAL